VTVAVRRFEGRVAAVTGGASGIGQATVRRLRAEGAHVWVLDRDGAAAVALAQELGDVAAVELDVADADAVTGAVDRILETHDRLDVMIANAGVTLEASIWETTPAQLARVVDVNLTGAFHCAARAMASMVARGRGAVVFTSSDAGLVGWPSQAAYCATKGALVALTRAAAIDAAPHNVRVNCVCPAFTATPLVDAWLAQTPDPEAARAEIASETPLGRIASPDEVAAAIAFLASDEARFITGVALPVDGGVTAQ
jgi:NAD(P)-dependent dehydrogenase (short-subunit alcohol dehydrogenase family)